MLCSGDVRRVSYAILCGVRRVSYPILGGVGRVNYAKIGGASCGERV